jgi:hypothetical protein
VPYVVLLAKPGEFDGCEEAPKGARGAMRVKYDVFVVKEGVEREDSGVVTVGFLEAGDV